MNAAKQAPSKPEVRICIADDTHASRISAVLEALGFEVVRELVEGDGAARLTWAVERLTRRHQLTSREVEVLAGILAGLDNVTLGARLAITRATVKWHVHNVFAKVGVSSREALLRRALQLGSLDSPDAPDAPEAPGHDRDALIEPEHWASPHDRTIKIE